MVDVRQQRVSKPVRRAAKGFTRSDICFRRYVPLGRAVLTFVMLCEAQLRVMFTHHGVSIGWTVDSDERAHAMFACVIKQFTQHRGFHTAAQHTATHQPGIDLPCGVAAFPADDDTDHPVIAKPVGQSHLESEARAIALRCFDLGFSVASRCQVELI